MDPYRIETNQAGRRILIIQDFCDIKDDNSLTANDFDIVYFDTDHLQYNQVRQLFSETSPIRCGRFYLKPRFMSIHNASMYERMDGLIDGYGVSAIDNDVTVKAEGILFQIEKLDAVRSFKEPADAEELFRRMCVYCFTREEYNFTATTIRSIAKGLSNVYLAYAIINHTLGSNENPDDADLRLLIKSLEDKKYIVRTNFVERIPLCPDCNSDHLVFSECCTKCNSSNLKEEDLIHHFRCANISPESDYLEGEMLRCPKCKRMLRHIGIDYDRPAKVQTCMDCHSQQFRSKIKVLCGTGGRVYTPSELNQYDIYEYNFNPLGIQEILKRGI